MPKNVSSYLFIHITYTILFTKVIRNIVFVAVYQTGCNKAIIIIEMCNIYTYVFINRCSVIKSLVENELPQTLSLTGAISLRRNMQTLTTSQMKTYWLTLQTQPNS